MEKETSGEVSKKSAVVFYARWQVRMEIANSVFNILFRFVQLAILCKVFNLPPIWYGITAIIAVIGFLGLAWLLDKMKLYYWLEKARRTRSEPWQELFKRLE